MPAGNVQEAGGAFITSITGSPTRSTTMTWYEQGPNGFYGNYGNQPNLRTRASVSVGGVTTQYSYDNALTTGNLTQVQRSDSGSECSPACSVSVTTSATYLGNGNVSTITDPNHYLTLLCYDVSNLYLTKQIVAAQPGASCANPTKLAEARETDYVNFADGSIQTATDVDNSITTTHIYDNLGRATSIEDRGTSASLGPSLDRVTTIQYDDVNNAISVTSPTQTNVTYYDALGRVREFVDGAGDIIQKAYRYGSGVSYELESNAYGVPATDPTTKGWILTTRDSMGRITAVDHYPGSNAPGYSTAGGPVTLPPAVANNPPAAWGTATTGTSTGKGTIAYNQAISACVGPATNITEEANNTYTNCYDGFGRLIAVTEPPVNSTRTTTTYSYDLLNNLVGVSLPGQSNCTVSFNSQTATRCFAYSISGLMSATNPEGGTNTYSYDNAGNLTGRRDANGTVTAAKAMTNPPGFTNYYDGLNRPYGWNYTVASNVAATPNVSYNYDQSFKGALSSVANTANASTSYSYDSLGRVAGSTQTVSSSGPFTFSYGYSLTDQLTSITYPSLRQVKYTLDAADRVSAVQNVTGGGNYATISYTAPSGMAAMTMGNGVTQQFSWNDRLQPVGVASASTQSSLLTIGFYPCPQNQTACATGNNGNLQSQTISFPAIGGAAALNLTQTYTYDALSRLSTAGEGTGSWSQSYGYDTAGNYSRGNRYVSANSGFSLSASTPTVATNFDAKNRLNVNNSAYDNNSASGNGNQTAIGGYTYVYDAENRLVGAYLSSGRKAISSTGYVYDGAGQRVQKITCPAGTNPCTGTSAGATITTYVYDVFGNLAAEYGAGSGSPPCNRCYLSVDQVGSTRLVTDSIGNVVRRYDYLPSGEELWVGPGGRTTTMGYQNGNDGFNPKFTGQMRDTETGLDYMHFRYYSPQEGRFVSVDPGNAGANAGDPQTWNAYSYVSNNPLSYTDPSGMFVCGSCAGSILGPVGAIVGGLVDLGLGLDVIFGGGGPSLPKWSDTAWELGPPLNMPGEFGDPWNESAGLSNESGTSNTGTLFGSGNTGPFVFSIEDGTAWWQHAWLQNTADFAAGLGDSLSFTLSARFRKYMRGGQDTRNHCSGYYTAGEVTALATGLMRLGYAGAAKALPAVVGGGQVTEEAARAVSSARNTLKVATRLGAFPNYRMFTWEQITTKYGTDYAKIISKASQTNPILNTAGGAMAGGAAVNLSRGCYE
jgi:RHS repeat-associated protein